MTSLISIIIPNRNGEATIGRCLEAAFASQYPHFEVTVVDDCSTDSSVEVIKRFPCKLIRLDKHSGASRTRNVGAAHSDGDILFFTDADCLLRNDALAVAAETLSAEGTGVIVGGTYTPIPYDNSFFSSFQSVFINYSETKRTENPDYVATHAMIIDAQVFTNIGGFDEHFLPILEDVELSHRLRKAGHRLIINPQIQVQHIFNYSLSRSLHNAIVKSMYWTIYSIRNGDLLADSGTASVGLKINVLAYFLSAFLLLAALWTEQVVFLWFIAVAVTANFLANNGLLLAFYRSKGLGFLAVAAAYYLLLYPLAVAAGALTGVMRYRSMISTLSTLGQNI
jgi:glycosyltransferase involved in cell wall biosynthesis